MAFRQIGIPARKVLRNARQRAADGSQASMGAAPPREGTVCVAGPLAPVGEGESGAHGNEGKKAGAGQTAPASQQGGQASNAGRSGVDASWERMNPRMPVSIDMRGSNRPQRFPTSVPRRPMLMVIAPEHSSAP